ncbi:DUF4856 domain-containing protein [Tenacibaculum sp. Bg11-29]|uniref:DUF4856 domain-containing protein n=1 Tax=Tenacibaculum sp. Bg11-29 TaxID=2058306 RepID=UPI000C331F8F|nr:DUF4856 domain-containing protein [Tenacibaculum sp. Bg11-29]PKH51204.1 DUF4856 domain-containing protein [Tenacibaculum sp. Bg11-29]
MKKVVFSILAISALVFTSCSSDGDTPINNVTAPTTYKFERNGNSSVSFSGQTTRIKMATELTSALKDVTKTEVALNEMFAHTAGNADFSDADLNTSSKSVRSKVAASVDFFAANTTDANAIKAKFDSWITEQVAVVYPNWAFNAVAGTAGKLEQNSGTARYINGKGVELNQIFAKGLIGALMADQMLNNYLSLAVLDAGTNITDNNAGTVATGKDYTTMEHKWDEAYGYLYGTEVNPEVPVLGADSFLNKYLGKVEADSDFAGVAKSVYDAFKLGRAAIVAKDYTLRDKQAEIIREKISEVIAIRTVHYLQAGKTLLATDKAAAFHDLSEGLGFLYSLQFTRKSNSASSYFTKVEIDGYLSDLLGTGNGLWEASTVATLDAVSSKIAAKFNFVVAETVN